MKKILILLLVMLFYSCADVQNIQQCLVDSPYTFWGGLWHGIIAPLSFIFSLFDDSVSMYAVNNNGAWYDFGFVIGAGILFGSSSSSSK